MECSNEDSIEVLDDNESLNELVRLFGKKYVQEELTVEADEENLEELDIFEDNVADGDIIHDISNVGNPLF